MIVDLGRYLQQENKPTDKIFDWVSELRKHRAGMVQSEEQCLGSYFALGVCCVCAAGGVLVYLPCFYWLYIT